MMKPMKKGKATTKKMAAPKPKAGKKKPVKTMM